jgi:hypothetical protein
LFTHTSCALRTHGRARLHRMPAGWATTVRRPFIPGLQTPARPGRSASLGCYFVSA